MESNMELGDIEFPPGVKDVSADMNPTELVKALKKCCKFFSQLEQDEEDMKRQYLPFCRYIVQDEFLKEVTDENCRIHMGCILADVFRLHAPENPFRSGEKVKEIFMFLTDRLKQLKDSKGSMFAKAYHILENVATIKSYNICIDLDDADAAGEIFCYLFKTLFSTVNSGHDKQLRSHMLDIMGFAITDSGSVPQPLLDIILECLLEKTRKMNPSANELAKDLLRRTANVIEQFIMLFFQNVVLANKNDVSKLSNQWTKLIPELYNITPTLLLNTLPQLELKLRVDNPKERLQVVALLSEMFSEKESNLANQYTTLWNCFLGRFNDIDAEVRATCVSFCRDLIINHGRESRQSKEVISFFKPRRHDTDENVRVAVVSSIRGIAMKDLQLASDELLEFLKERVLDKKWRVREAVIRAMADIYKKYTVGEHVSKIHTRRLQSFKSRLLHVYYRQNMDDCMLLERVFVSSLVPYTLSNKDRMKHLLELYASVDEKAVKSLMEILKKQRSIRISLVDIINAFDIPDEKEQNSAIHSKVMFIASQMPGNTQHARDTVNKFIRIVNQDPKMRQWLTYIVGEKYTCQKVAVAVRDMLKKLESDGTPKAVKVTTQQLLERAVIVPVLIDASSLKRATPSTFARNQRYEISLDLVTKRIHKMGAKGVLFELVKESLDGVSDIDELNTEDAQQRSMDLLKTLALLAPHLYSSAECFEDLLGFLRRTREENIVQQSLIILEHTAPVIEENFTEIRSVLLPELKNKAKSSTSSQVKHAIFCMNKFTSVREVPLMQVFDYCKDLVTSESPSFNQMQSILTALGCIAEVLPDKAAVQLRSVIASVVVKQVIMKTSSNTNVVKGRKKEQKWCEKFELSRETKTKIAGMKCIVRWLHGLRSNDCDCCGSTLRLLQHMLHNEGDLMKSGNITLVDMAHLRLQAAYCVLKIAQVAEFHDLFKPDIYQELAMLINDSVLEVRRNFLNRLYKSLFRFQIHVSFLCLFSMVSQETLKEQREQGTYLYHQLIKRNREFGRQNLMGSARSYSILPEYMLPHLVFLLANDPDFLEGISKRSLARLKDCIHFILDPLLTKDHPESFGFIKRLAENLKRSKNADNPTDVQRNENIYAVCDMIVQHVLQRSSQYAVAILEPVNTAVMKHIPRRLYTPPSGPENNKVYLPREFYANVKHVPTPATTAAMGGDKYRKGFAHQSTSLLDFGFEETILEKPQKRKKMLNVFGGSSKMPRKKPQPVLKSPSTPNRTASQSTLSTSQSSSPLPKRQPASLSSSSLPTPPTSQNSASPDTVNANAVPVRTSGRKRKPRSLSPPLPMTSSPSKKSSAKSQSKKKSVSQESTEEDASESEENESSPLPPSKRSKLSSKKAESASRKAVPLKGKRSVVASASVKTASRKTLGVSNGNSGATNSNQKSTTVRRSARKRGK